MTKVIAITGWDRSGSTIVAAALGSVPGICTLGEVTNVWERGFEQNQVCSCGQPFSTCELWASLADRAFGDSVGSVPDRARAAMSQLGNATLAQRQLRGTELDPSAGSAYQELLRKVYEAGAEVTGAQVLVDSSKKPWHTAMADALTDFEVYVLHVGRDPRGVAYSFQKQIA